jgi:hypothetical protein
VIDQLAGIDLVALARGLDAVAKACEHDRSTRR